MNRVLGSKVTFARQVQVNLLFLRIHPDLLSSLHAHNRQGSYHSRNGEYTLAGGPQYAVHGFGVFELFLEP